MNSKYDIGSIFELELPELGTPEPHPTPDLPDPVEEEILADSGPQTITPKSPAGPEIKFGQNFTYFPGDDGANAKGHSFLSYETVHFPMVIDSQLYA